MISIISVFLLVYTLSFGIIIFIGFFQQRVKERSYEEVPFIDPEEIAVLVPFRNEENRVLPLLKSIKMLNVKPGKFIFIDDHSDDRGVEIIKNELHGLNFEVVCLPSGCSGKKEALRYAIEEVNRSYILTMDADVVIPEDYFSRLMGLRDADMYVLPAIMKADKFMHYFYEVDLILVNAANAGLAGLKRPIMASGANLFYRKYTFDRVDDLASHAHAASGDDTYLLRDFRLNDCDVRLHTDPELGIYTETPQSFKEFIDQRLRWIGKTSDIRDHLSTTLAVVQSLLTLVFLVLCALLIIKGLWIFLLLLYLAKTGIDMVLFFPYFNRIGRMVTWCFIPLYEFFFPVYTLIILILMPIYKPQWKGRKIYEN